MSYFIVKCLVPGYEDNDEYGCKGNAYAGFPALWPEERAAERAIYQEWKEMRDGTSMWLRYNRTVEACENDEEERDPNELPVIVRALVSLAKENGWKVKNADFAEHYNVKLIYTIPPEKEDEPMPTRWNDIVRWMDRQKTREEEEAKRKELAKAEREEKRRRDDRIIIDWKALFVLMGGVMPNVEIAEVPTTLNPTARRCKNVRDIQEMVLARLADENGWKQNEVAESIDRRVYKIV